MKQFVIVGNSAAGIAAIEAIRQRDSSSKILVFCDEDYPAYCRCLISYYLAQDIKEEKVLYRTDAFYKENNVELFLNKKVSRVDPKKNRIVCEDKTQASYDSLLIATGASPKFPDIKGIKKDGVFGFRTMKNTKDIATILPIVKTAVVLGGGLIGLKAAYGLKKRGIEVKVVIKSRQVLSQVLDFEAASFVQKKLEENGIEIILGTDATEIIGDGDIKAVKLETGKVVASSIVIVGKGVSPNIDLVKEAGMKINEGIVSNDLLGTSLPNIYTAGDVCESLDLVSGSFSINALWPVAVEQGKIAGSNMAGDNIRYPGSLGMNSLEFFGLPVVSLGAFKVKEGDTSFEQLKIYDPNAGLYKKLVLKNNILVGAVSVSDIRNSGIFLRLIREKIDVSSIKDRLLQENFGYPDIMGLVKEKEQLYV